eukprot:UN31773
MALNQWKTCRTKIKFRVKSKLTVSSSYVNSYHSPNMQSQQYYDQNPYTYQPMFHYGMPSPQFGALAGMSTNAHSYQGNNSSGRRNSRRGGRGQRGRGGYNNNRQPRNKQNSYQRTKKNAQASVSQPEEDIFYGKNLRR